MLHDWLRRADPGSSGGANPRRAIEIRERIGPRGGVKFLTGHCGTFRYLFPSPSQLLPRFPKHWVQHANDTISNYPPITDIAKGVPQSPTPSNVTLWFERADRLLDDGDLEGADAALYAADRAQKQGRSDDAVLDALEAAEMQYKASHQPGENHPQSAQCEFAPALLTGLWLSLDPLTHIML